MKTRTCLAIALLAGGSATVQAERRADWELAVALAPMVDAPFEAIRFALPDPEAVDVPGFSVRHEVQALPLPEFTPADMNPVVVPGFSSRHEVQALPLPDFGYAEVWAAAELLPIPEFALAALTAQPEEADLPDMDALGEMEALADADSPAPDGWTAMDGDSLADMRGGFTMPGGLVVSLGIERLVSINGEVVARTTFALPSGGTVGDVAAAAREALGGGLIQNGPGNVSLATMAPEALGATIIQNTLNDQTIRSQTVINASVNSATLMQSLNFNDSLGQAIRNAIGSH